MSIFQLLRKITPFIKPYKIIIIFTLLLTLLGSLAAQVNAFILRYTVDSIDNLMVDNKPLKVGFTLLLFISLVLFSKEILNVLIQFGQKFYGEKLRIFISRDFSQSIVEKIFTY
ncbi:MAG: ABC transporter, partial [Saprospiraceae bacterium]